jgi:hypothetical protein
MASRLAGARGWPEYDVWLHMKNRCANPSHHAYACYGGRGISVCERWRKSYFDFISDMGRRPTPKHTVERENNNGNYEPGNCRWATYQEQANNRRNNRILVFQGTSQTLTQWGRQFKLRPSTIWSRIKYLRWPVERALTQSARPLKKGVAA